MTLKRKAVALILAGGLLAGIAAGPALAGSTGYEGQPGNQSASNGNNGNGPSGYEGQPGNQGGH